MFNPIWLVIWTVLAYLTTILSKTKPFMEWKPVKYTTENIYEQKKEHELGPGCFVSLFFVLWRIAAVYYAVNALENSYGDTTAASLVAAAAVSVIFIYCIVFALATVIVMFETRGFTNDFIEKVKTWTKTLKDYKQPIWQEIILKAVMTYIPLAYMTYLCYLQFA